MVYGYYKQSGIAFKPGDRAIDVVKRIGERIDLGNGRVMSAGQFLEYFLFTDKQQYSPVEKLSGGERRRLYLLTVLMRNPNFLILDEPTNDLDIVTLNVLEEYLKGFKGCLLIVSHDRFFMDKVVDRVFAFEGNGVVKDFPGNYTQYKNKKEEEREAQERAEREQRKAVPKPAPTKTVQEKKRRLSFKEQREMEELEAAITPKTKILVLPFPNNPTGAILTREELLPLAEIVQKHDLYVVSDEIYSELTYLNQHCSIASLPGMRERTILINGFSKSFAMTGWRLGYACGPKQILKQMLKIHQYAIMCAPTASQYAAVEALRNCGRDVEEMRESYNQRRRFLMHEFKRMQLECFEPYGAFYVFPCIREFGMTAEEFAVRLLEEEKVAVVPGTAFGDSGEGFIRISYAYSLADLKKALERLSSFIDRLRSQH